MTTIAYIVGSTAADSLNRRLAGALIADAPEGVDFVEVTIADLPIYNADDDANFLPLAREKKTTLEGVDGLIVLTPEYNKSVSGVLKNAIDWISRPWGEKSLSGKKTLVASAAISPRAGATAREHLKEILGQIEAEPVDAAEIGLFVQKDQFGEDGRITDAEMQARVKAAITAFVEALRA
ncbi:NAD(P)H-dependent oxidoreductase [Schaalia sp. 19OD2882]|uniref:NADPH-dependent FMN reductase n=1 Tax=Schaalia sp. 19OD2882 TaxID=2794089 RepID=UPI001C1E9B24|nr:NAD(P)H-dependent oxidoreductase [Schaalia sp. 19OD2882]QWW19378.1 NAD(P)H-dependent oxidoreductase [Schaalia sp. 19OD2882]